MWNGQRDSVVWEQAPTMSDIFISYAREDESRVIDLANEFERLGWTVWHDRNIGASAEFDQAIEHALDAATCVVVVWSRSSIASRWVRAEAARAEDQGKLIPVSFERDVRPPLPFNQLNVARLGSTSLAHPTGGELALLTEIAARTRKAPRGMDPRLATGRPAGGRSGARTVTAGTWRLTTRFFLAEAWYEFALYPDGTVSGTGRWTISYVTDISGRWYFDKGRDVLQLELSGGISPGMQSMQIAIHEWEDDDTALCTFQGREARLERQVG